MRLGRLGERAEGTVDDLIYAISIFVHLTPYLGLKICKNRVNLNFHKMLSQ
jgi:hypothetical protein